MSVSGIPGSASNATDLTTFTITVDGSELPGTVRIFSIEVVREVNRIPSARIVMNDGDVALQDFELSAGDLFVPGARIEIHAGYGGDDEPIFKGVLTYHRIRAGRTGGSRLVIEAKDAVFRMALDSRSKYFLESTDSDVFEELISGHADLTSAVDATTEVYDEVVQYRATDWDFLVTRAERIGMICLVEDGTVRVASPDAQQDAVTSITYGMGMFDIDMEIDARTQFPSVTVSAWDPADQALVSSDVTDVTVPEHGNFTAADLAEVGAVESAEARHTGTLGQAELDAWAEARLARSRLAKVRGTVRLQGTETILPGMLVDIAGVGDRFNGRAYVSGVRHRIARGDWETTIQVGLDPRWHYERFPVTTAPAAGHHPGVRGLHIGVVTQIDLDPAGEHRVQVRVPTIDAEGSGAWTRIVTLDAGEERGSFFRPEIGDEVVVGYLYDDPRHPVMLGMLNSSSRKPAFEASSTNPEKGFVTSSGLRLVFDDQTPSVTIDTPKGNSIVIDDGANSIALADSAGNTITLEAGAITLDSAADLTLRAQGTLELSAANIKIGASASLTAEGGASAAFKSGGATEVKGAIVKIN